MPLDLDYYNFVKNIIKICILTEMPELDTDESERLRVFISWLNASKPYTAPLQVIREDSKSRHIFVQHMIEDRLDGSFSYFEFLQHLKQQSK